MSFFLILNKRQGAFGKNITVMIFQMYLAENKKNFHTFAHNGSKAPSATGQNHCSFTHLQLLKRLKRIHVISVVVLSIYKNASQICKNYHMNNSVFFSILK